MVTDKICLIEDEEKLLIRVALSAHINQCERYRSKIYDAREYEYIGNKIEKMKNIIEKL